MGFQYGFYQEREELRRDDEAATFGFLDNIQVTDESSAYNFLHGCCDEFAATLSDMFGYEIECFRNADGRLIHAYCVSYIGDEKAYIDVRGITTDPALFFEEFHREAYYYPPTGSILVEDEDGREVAAAVESWASKDELFEGEYEDWSDSQIEAFVKDYKGYYDSSKFISVYKCKTCGSEFVADDPEDRSWFADYGEEALWGHIQLDHPEVYEDCQDLETPDMLELCFEHMILKNNRELAVEYSTAQRAPEKGSLDEKIAAANDILRAFTPEPSEKTPVKDAGFFRS